jgi:hypothetical protein
MLQSGVGTRDLDVRWVSSISWYFLTLFGLQPIYNFILGSDNSKSGHIQRERLGLAKLMYEGSGESNSATDGNEPSGYDGPQPRPGQVVSSGGREPGGYRTPIHSGRHRRTHTSQFELTAETGARARYLDAERESMCWQGIFPAVLSEWAQSRTSPLHSFSSTLSSRAVGPVNGTCRAGASERTPCICIAQPL